MSIYSDYAVGAMSDVEFHNACVEENARGRWEREHLDDIDEYTDEENEENERGKVLSDQFRGIQKGNGAGRRVNTWSAHTPRSQRRC